MKKMTKLLSVILAFVMALSCMTMMASAAKTNYKTVADLDALHAYSPYGTVTRLDSEARTSILLDFLDNMLAPMDSLNMGQLFNVFGLSLTINLTSVDAILGTFDNIKSLRSNGLVSLVSGLLGLLADLEVGTWESGMSRDKTAQVTIVAELLEFLSANTGLVTTVFNDGINLGLANSALPDLSGINNLVKNLPGALTPFILSMLSRPDDDATDRNEKSSTNPATLVSTVQKYIVDAFSSSMSTTSYREYAESGSDAGRTLPLPTTTETSRYFVREGDTFTQYDYKYNGLMDSLGGVWEKTAVYSKVQEYEGSDTYVFRTTDGALMQWYKADGAVDNEGNVQSQYLLPSVAKAIQEGKLSFDINGADSLGSLLYKFIPYIFAEMAPTVLNGSAKKLIAEAFDVKFEELKGDALEAAIAATGNPDNFFTKPQEYYVWEYTDYIVVADESSYNGYTPYYRYQDKYFKGTVPSNISHYYEMFNWNWKIDDEFLNEYVPGSVGSGYLVDGLNNLIGKAIKTMLKDSWTYKGISYNLSDFFTWQEGGNEKLLENFMNAARGFFKIAPEEILDEYYKDAQFYEPMMNGSMSQALNGLVCELVKLIMPQIKFPDAIVDAPITAIAAIVVRELCTQLMPTYNFDDMIYVDYTARTLVSHSADEWLDITLYMGVNLGMYYLRNLADIGEDDTTLGYYAVMSNLGALPALSNLGTTQAADAIKFSADSYKISDGTASWLVMVDWVADWALSSQALWCWKFGNFVDVTGTVDLTTYQNPLDKISSVFTALFPELENLLNTSGFEGGYGSTSVLAKILKNGLVDSIVNLKLENLLGMLKLPSNSILVSTNLVDSLINKILKPLLNGIFYKLAGGKNLIPDAINSVSTLLNQTNLRTFVVNLVGALYPAYGRGLLDTILPILGFFVGWKTDPQEYSEPLLITASSSFTSSTYSDQAYLTDTDYLYAPNGSVTTSFSVTNNSSGMLLRHRNSETTDHAYDIQILSVESGTPGVTVSASRDLGTIGPYDSASCDVTISGASGTQMVNIIVRYKLIGKDGNADGVGGEQVESVYKLVSDVNVNDAWTTSEQSATGSTTSKGGTAGSTTAAKAKLWTYRTQFVIGDFNEIAKYSVRFENTGSKNEWLYQLTDNSTNAGPFKLDTDVVHGANENESLKANGKGFMYNDSDDGSTTWDYYSYMVGDANYDKTTGQHFNLGYTVKFINGDSRDYNLNDSANLSVNTEILYYNVDELAPYVANPLFADDYDTAAAGDKWTAYLAALADAAFLVNGPKRVDTFDATYNPENVAAKLKAIEDAVENLEEYASSSTSGGDISVVSNKLAQLETNPDRDINFQDYKLFEYFKYENERTAAREMIKATEPPAAPESYIGSVYGDALVNAIIASDVVQSRTVYKQGVPKTVQIDDDDDYQRALAEFEPANYSRVTIENQAAMLQYYYDFMILNTKGTPDKTFLNKEIAYADATYTADQEAIYSVDSWSDYTTKLAKAKEVAADGGATESQIFDAKYALMVAENNLLEKTKSMKDNIESDGSTYLAKEMEQLIAVAKAIIEQYDTSYYQVNPNAGVSVDEALAALVSALGIEYNVSVDGKDYSGILYDRSAITFTAYDRINTVKNKRAVDAAADKLREAISYFECSAKITSKDDKIDVVSDHDNLLVVGFNPNSIVAESDLEEKLNFGTPAGGSKVITTSKAGFYGTGTSLVINDENGVPLVSYFVVIFGDVNGDGAIDAFDAIEVDYAYHVASYHMGNIYDDAADLNHDGIIDDTDYGMLVAGVQCTDAISQELPSAE